MMRHEGHDGDDARFSSTTRGAHALADPKRLRVRCLTAMRALARKWRNWQTRRIQDPVVATPWGFKSPLSHVLSQALRARRRGHGTMGSGSGTKASWVERRLSATPVAE